MFEKIFFLKNYIISIDTYDERIYKCFKYTVSFQFYFKKSLLIFAIDNWGKTCCTMLLTYSFFALPSEPYKMFAFKIKPWWPCMWDILFVDVIINFLMLIKSVDIMSKGMSIGLTFLINGCFVTFRVIEKSILQLQHIIDKVLIKWIF